MIEQLRGIWTQAVAIWISGGWCMPGLAAIALLMFALGAHVHLKLGETGFKSVPERRWRRWLTTPGERRGPVGALLDFVTAARSLDDMRILFRELRSTETAPFDRDLKVMKICVGAAPLLGLLGTVTGMLVTFNALASPTSGAEQTMQMIADGISQALVTTETGLVIALPGMFFQYQLARKYDAYKAFLAHLETVCTQEMYRKLHRGDGTEQAGGAESARMSRTEGAYGTVS
jgi:biopolymer transport protein ExbB